MGLTAAEKKRFESLAQRLHIEFVEKFDNLDDMSVRDQTITLLKDIGDLESKEYETADKLSIMPIGQRKAITKRAKKIAFKARNLKLDRSKVSTSSAPKESTWRFKTEIPIFESLEQPITW